MAATKVLLKDPCPSGLPEVLTAAHFGPLWGLAWRRQIQRLVPEQTKKRQSQKGSPTTPRIRPPLRFKLN